jgi:hypothetical protein
MTDKCASSARRRREVLSTAMLLGSVIALVVTIASPVSSASSAHRVRDRVAPAIHLEWPAGLAIARNGDLIIADQRLNEVLERLPSGALRVIAGTGRVGFSGDGGPAVDAQLHGPTALAVSANGTIYVDDQGNNRVRALLPDGRITSVAGSGAMNGAPITLGSVATSVAMSPSALTIDSNGQLYVATSNEVVELARSGVVMKVINLNKTPGVKMRYRVCDPEAIGFDPTGNLFLGCGNSRELIERMTNGHFALVESAYRPHDFPGMAFTEGGALLIANGEVLFGVIDNHATPLIGLKTFPHSVVCVPSGIAVSKNGTIYTDCQSGDGFDTGAGLVKITPGGGVVLLRLWKEQ